MPNLFSAEWQNISIFPVSPGCFLQPGRVGEASVQWVKRFRGAVSVLWLSSSCCCSVSALAAPIGMFVLITLLCFSAGWELTSQGSFQSWAVSPGRSRSHSCLSALMQGLCLISLQKLCLILCHNLKPPVDIIAVPQLVLWGYAHAEEITLLYNEYLVI